MRLVRWVDQYSQPDGKDADLCNKTQLKIVPPALADTGLADSALARRHRTNDPTTSPPDPVADGDPARDGTGCQKRQCGTRTADQSGTGDGGNS